MFKKLSTLIAVTAIVASPAMADFSTASKDMSRASLKVTGNLATTIFQASGTVGRGTADASVGYSKSFYTAAKKSVMYSGQISKAGIDFTVEAVEGSVAVMATTAAWSGARLSDAKNFSVQVVTTTGDIISGAYNYSKKAVNATLDYSGNVVDASGKVIGQMSEAAGRGAQWSKETAGRAITVSINASGKVMNASGKTIGYIVDKTGKAVNFMMTASGHMIQFSKETLVVTFNASKGAIKELYKGSKYVGGKAINASGMAIKAVVNAAGDVLFTSAKTAGLSLTYTFEGKPSEALRIVAMLPANTIKALIYSDMHYQGIE